MTEYFPGRRQRRPPQGRRPRADSSDSPASPPETDSEERTAFDSSARRSWVVAPGGDETDAGTGTGTDADQEQASTGDEDAPPAAETVRVRAVPGRSTPVSSATAPVHHVTPSADDVAGEPPTTPLSPVPSSRRGRRAGPPREETSPGPVLPPSAGGRHGTPGHHRADAPSGDDAAAAGGVTGAGEVTAAAAGTPVDDEFDAWGAAGISATSTGGSPSSDPHTVPADAAGPADAASGDEDASPAGATPDPLDPADAASPTEAASASASADGSGGPPDGPTKRPLQPNVPRPDPPRTGSLPRAAGWTLLTSIIPGLGLVTTRLRALGWALLVVLVLLIGGAAIWLSSGTSPLMTLVKVLTSRKVLIGVLIAVAVVGVIWLAQIAISNLAHNTKEKLGGPRRIISMCVAAALMVIAAVPFGWAGQNVWSLQDLIGNEKVFVSSHDDGKGPIKPGKDPWAGTERVNIMLLGQDAGKDRTGTRPDTIMVASIDTKTGKTALFSIPRNLEHVRFPKGTAPAKEFPNGFHYFGQGQDLINAVWTWANDRKDLFPGDKDPGRTATTLAVQETLGLKIDYYAMVDLQGFSDLVDAIGGVDMDVERKIPIGGGTNQATGGKYPIDGYIQPGQQKLNGKDALWYARSREGSNDFNRICRQQRMVRVVSEQANPTKLALSFNKLVGAAGANIETDVPADRLDAFVDLAGRVQEGGFTSYPITSDVTDPSHADWKKLKRWTDKSIKDSMGSEGADSVSNGDEKKDSSSTKGKDDEKKGKDDEKSASAEPEDEETTDGDEASSSEDSKEDAKKKAEREKKEDPLWSCMPGTADANP
jgi:LCP family protein required for cell wall assembly